MLRLLLRPGAEGLNDLVAQQNGEMIAFGEYREIDGRAEPADDIRYSIGMAIERREIGRCRNHRSPHDCIAALPDLPSIRGGLRRIGSGGHRWYCRRR